LIYPKPAHGVTTGTINKSQQWGGDQREKSEMIDVRKKPVSRGGIVGV